MLSSTVRSGKSEYLCGTYPRVQSGWRCSRPATPWPGPDLLRRSDVVTLAGHCGADIADQLRDVLALEARGGAGLAEESLGCLGVRHELGEQELDRDLRIELEVPRFDDESGWRRAAQLGMVDDFVERPYLIALHRGL